MAIQTWNTQQQQQYQNPSQGTMPQQGSQQQNTQTQPPRPAQNFAQMQAQGMARPAPPQAQPFQQYQGSQQANQARTQMMTNLQQQLAQPTRFDTNAFNQIRQAQMGNLNAEFGAQRSQLEEEMARRGLSASSIAGGRYGDLAGQQARATATLDSQLLQQAAQTQAQDRLAALQAGGEFANLAGAQDLQQFEANRVGQAAEFEQGLRGAQFGQGQYEFEQNLGLEGGRLGEQSRQFDLQNQLQRELGMGNLGVSQQEVNLRAQALQQEAALQGRSLSLQEAQAQATNDLNNRRLQTEQQQFGQSLAEQQANRLQQGQMTERELNLRAQQLQQQAELEGRSLSLAEANALAQQEQFRSSQAQDRELSNLERQLRETLGTGDLDVRRQQAEADQRLAQSGLMMQLAQMLGNLDATQIRNLFGGSGTPLTGSGNTPGGTNVPTDPKRPVT